MHHSLEGLMNWTNRPEWDESFESVIALHLGALNEYELTVDELVDRVGEPAFRMLHDFAFEDFLTNDPDEGRNPIDAFLAKRGWKETPATRAYLTALRGSVVSLYEVSDVRPGVSMLVRDLLRGGERVLVEEKSATATLHDWNIIAARIVSVRGKTMLGGGALLLDRSTADALVIEVNDVIEALRDDHRKLAKQRRIDVPDNILGAAIAALDSIDVVLQSSAFLFSAAWLRMAIDRTDPANRPQVRTREGDPVEPVTLSFKFRPKVTVAQVRHALNGERVLYGADLNFWNWAIPDAGPSGHGSGGLSFESRLENGHLVLGSVEIRRRSVQLQTLSRARAERGTALLAPLLGSLVHTPVEIEPEINEATAELELSEADQRNLVYELIDAHYMRVLDEPVPMLDGMTPREAAAKREGKRKAVDWLKELESSLQKMPDASGYDCSWIWQELGLSQHRR